MISDDWTPSFAKITQRSGPTLENDPLQLSASALGLDGLQAVYRNPRLPLQMRIRAMIAALPFETPKLAVTATVSEHDFATLLDRRLKRIEEMKAKEIGGPALVWVPAPGPCEFACREKTSSIDRKALHKET